jgi:hypothetical protein
LVTGPGGLVNFGRDRLPTTAAASPKLPREYDFFNRERARLAAQTPAFLDHAPPAAAHLGQGSATFAREAAIVPITLVSSLVH